MAKEQGRVVFLLQLLDALDVLKKLIRGLVDGAAGGQLVAVALGGVNGVAGGDDVPMVLGVQDEADDTGGVGLLDKQRQVVRQLGRLVDGFELDRTSSVSFPATR